MPKRSERHLYADSFKGNPYEGMTLDEIYSSLRWGHSPDQKYEINAPEPLVGMGNIAALHFRSFIEAYDEENAPHLAVGAQSNMLYVLPLDVTKIPDLSDKGWKCLGFINETHYYSDKGDSVENYYYHKHERPLPLVYEHANGAKIIVPANNRGTRSYAVDTAGIIG